MSETDREDCPLEASLFGARPEMPIVFVRAGRRSDILLGQELMIRTEEPLAQMALSCGLCDQSHFTRTFERVVGMSPRETGD